MTGESLGTFCNGVAITRRDRYVVARFVRPHRMLSTDLVHGGQREDLDGVVNHQSCLADDEAHEFFDEAGGDATVYKRLVLSRIGLDPERFAYMGTGAKMANLALRHEAFRDVELAVACTAGETNAVRAGDPADYHEAGGAFVPVCGTINVMLFIGRELTPGALVDAAMTLTEAKAAALQDAGIRSKVSGAAATGTGTDQMAVASLLGGRALTGAGKHTKLGELIGRNVRDAVIEALRRQKENDSWQTP